MKLSGSDPEIETLVARINRGDLDLQPDFQRGEVWSESKKRRLIDTILRNWHVPPVHVVVVNGTGAQEVLDGQQRLAAIRDFANGEIKIDGRIEPVDEEILELDGLSYTQIPIEWRRRFDSYPIRMFKISDYKPEEPGELFFRLNQPSNLTSAEQRNAFFGDARKQIKDLVENARRYGIDKDFIGFGNTRMAYDDVIARICTYAEHGNLRVSMSSTLLADRYRKPEGFSESIVGRVDNTLKIFGSTRGLLHKLPFKANKATLFSWLWLVYTLESTKFSFNQTTLSDFLLFFMQTRRESMGDFEKTLVLNGEIRFIMRDINALYYIFDDRSSSRVLDVHSVNFRDIILRIFHLIYLSERSLWHKDTDGYSEVIQSVLKRRTPGEFSINPEGILYTIFNIYSSGEFE